MKAKERADLVKNMVRSVFTAPEGKLLYVADFASIEARVVMWFAKEKQALDAFRKGADIYCQMAEKIYGYPCNKKDHPEERFNGKSCILGAGFGMGVKKFKEQYNVSDDQLAQKCINAYRIGYPGVKQSWDEVELGFKTAMRGKETVKRGLHFSSETIAGKHTVVMRLPSGRCLFYYEPEYRAGDYGEDLYIKIKDSKGMFHRKTWGGDLFQDAVQGTARDLCVHGTLEVERRGFLPVMSVHDEVVALADEDRDLDEFCGAFSQTPEWGSDIPVDVEGWIGKYYRKG